MTTVTIDLGHGRTVPLTPPEELGMAFAAVVAEALSWDPGRRIALEALSAGSRGSTLYTEAADRVSSALSHAGLAWSQDFGTEGAEVEAGPYIDTLAGHGMAAAAGVAAAVLARDLRLITPDDFVAVTTWWTTAGLPLPDAGYYVTRSDDDTTVWATGPDEVLRTAHELRRERYRVPGWPTGAVSTLGMTVAEGRYAGMPGLNWYADSRQATADELVVGDWVDTDDRSGARRIESIPADQVDNTIRVVVISGDEPVILRRDRTHRVVDPATLVDVTTKQPVVLCGGPVDGHVTYIPPTLIGAQHCRPDYARQRLVTGSGPKLPVVAWAPADAWPADDERYAPADARDEVVAAVMTWRLPTAQEITAARRDRERREGDR